MNTAITTLQQAVGGVNNQTSDEIDKVLCYFYTLIDTIDYISCLKKICQCFTCTNELHGAYQNEDCHHHNIKVQIDLI